MSVANKIILIRLPVLRITMISSTKVTFFCRFLVTFHSHPASVCIVLIDLVPQLLLLWVVSEFVYTHSVI